MNKSKIPGMLEFLIWILYGLVSVACLGLAAFACAQISGYGMVPGLVGAIVAALITGLFAVGVHKALGKESIRMLLTTKACMLAEGAAFVIMLAGMIVLRFGVSWSVAGSGVYESALVTGEIFYADVAHGGCRVYLYLLNLVLMLLGNKTFAAVILQLLLLAGAAVTLYLGVRKLAGVPAALLVAAFLGFSPYMVSESIKLTPFLVFVLFYGLALIFIGCISDCIVSCNKLAEQIAAVVCYIASGVLVGICCYLDVAGITLLIILTGVICFGDGLRLRVEESWSAPSYENVRPGSIKAFEIRCSEFLSNPVFVFGGTIFVAVFSFCKMHGSTGSVSRQLGLYPIGTLQVPFAVDAGNVAECILVSMLLIFGVCSFWFSRKIGKRVIWFFAAALLAVMLCIGMSSEGYMNSSAVLYLLCVILAGSGIPDVLAEAKKREEGQSEAEDEELQMSIIDMDTPQTETSPEEEQEPVIEFIENPLPLPKKHTKKVMDYDYEVPEDDDFDH